MSGKKVMNNVVFQVSIAGYDKSKGGYLKGTKTFTYAKNLYDFSNERAKEYAKKYDADYFCLTEPWEFLGDSYAPCYHKFYIYELLKKYDKVLYIDSDAIFTKYAPNLFTLNGFASVRDWPYTKKGDVKTARKLKVMGIDNTDHEYFCSCIMLLDQDFYKKTKDVWWHDLQYWKKIKKQGAQHDQAIFNRMVASRIGEYNVLDGHWGAWWKSNPKYLVHYANVTPKLKFTVEEFLEKEPKGRIPTEDIFTVNGSGHDGIGRHNGLKIRGLYAV